MSFKRRAFLNSLMGLAALPAVVRATAKTSDEVDPKSGPEYLLPKGLRQGATIGIVCPASAAVPRDIIEFTSLCSRYGMQVRHGENMSRRSGYLAASDEARARELMTFVNDPSIDAIVCARGGYGVMRILPMLDFGAIRDSQKLIMGFSDITALLVAVNQIGRMVTFHGPVASSSFDPFTVDSLSSVTMLSEPPSPLLSYQDPSVTTLGPGTAKGRLTGGNLSMLVSTLGTRYEVDTTDSILFLEEISEEPYRVDRMLTQMWLAGKLQSCRGIAIGAFRDCEAKGVGIPGPSLTLMQVLEARISSLGIPAVYGLPFGHVRSKLTLPLGVVAELDATNKSMRLLGRAVV